VNAVQAIVTVTNANLHASMPEILAPMIMNAVAVAAIVWADAGLIPSIHRRAAKI
jgi:hypothetical protein